MLTARAEDEQRLAGLLSGANACIAKPFSGSELLAIAEHLIEVRRRLRQRASVPDWMATHVRTLPSHDAQLLDRIQTSWVPTWLIVSPRQLQRSMRTIMRLSAGGFIKTLRMDGAAQLLRQTDLQVAEVARAVGYEDAGYFSIVFRQDYGAAPSRFGRQHADEASAQAGS